MRLPWVINEIIMKISKSQGLHERLVIEIIMSPPLRNLAFGKGERIWGARWNTASETCLFAQVVMPWLFTELPSSLHSGRVGVTRGLAWGQMCYIQFGSHSLPSAASKQRPCPGLYLAASAWWWNLQRWACAQGVSRMHKSPWWLPVRFYTEKSQQRKL